MHEFGIAEDILRHIKSLKAAAQKFKVRIGESLAVTGQEVREAFAMISTGSPYEHAELSIEIAPLKAACSDCGSEFAPRTFSLNCPKCGGKSIRIISGQGIEVIPQSEV